MTNAWQEYKKKLGTTRPWDVVNSNVPKLDESEAEKRMNICLSCDRLIQSTKQCRECGCFMKLKTKIASASCPLQKW